MNHAQKSDKRFLITTPLFDTWNCEKPLLLLGEWCSLYSRREIIANADIQVNSYHWDDREKFKQDYYILEDIYEKKLTSLSISLNKIHGINRDIRFWRIIVGPWLRFFIDALYDRYEIIRSLSKKDIDDTWIKTYSLTDWIPIDFNEFYTQFRYDSWNHVIFSECIKHFNIPYTLIDKKIFPESGLNKRQPFLNAIFKAVMNLYNSVLPSYFNRIVFIAAYMPKFKLLKLQATLCQLPYLYSPNIRVKWRLENHKKRELLIFDEPKYDFESILDKLIIQLIPFAYVENFKELYEKCLLSFPAKPKLIFTANAYQSDDGFKVWAAHHVNHGVPLVIEQHGGHFGIGFFNQTEDHQFAIADFFATWGWNNEIRKNIKPLPGLKLKSKKISTNPKGEILLTVASYPRYFYCYFSAAVSSQFSNYLQQQICFSKLLSPPLVKLLKIRTDLDVFGWEIHERFTNAGFAQSLEDAKVDLYKRLKNCRISVSTYNATIFLETLALNFPTIVYFDPNLYQIRSSAQGAMNKLREVSILHDSPQSAAMFLNEVGSDVESWWNLEKVQLARLEFCQSYAYTSKDWINIWKTFFYGVINTNN